MGVGSEAAKYLKEKKKLARTQGWRIEEVAKGTKFLPPDPNSPAVIVHKTPSDSRWMKNKDADFRRSGLVF